MNIPPLLSPEETLDKMIDDVKNYAAIYARKSIQTPNGSLEVQKKSCTTYSAKNSKSQFLRQRPQGDFVKKFKFST